jgi:hypothetical protein
MDTDALLCGRGSRIANNALADEERMELVCMHCRKLQTPRGRWIKVPEARIEELRNEGQLTYGCCFACTRELFGLNPERRPETTVER